MPSSAQSNFIFVFSNVSDQICHFLILKPARLGGKSSPLPTGVPRCRRQARDAICPHFSISTVSYGQNCCLIVSHQRATKEVKTDQPLRVTLGSHCLTITSDIPLKAPKSRARGCQEASWESEPIGASVRGCLPPARRPKGLAGHRPRSPWWSRIAKSACDWQVPAQHFLPGSSSSKTGRGSGWPGRGKHLANRLRIFGENLQNSPAPWGTHSLLRALHLSPSGMAQREVSQGVIPGGTSQEYPGPEGARPVCLLGTSGHCPLKELPLTL